MTTSGALTYAATGSNASLSLCAAYSASRFIVSLELSDAFRVFKESAYMVKKKRKKYSYTPLLSKIFLVSVVCNDLVKHLVKSNNIINGCIAV